jgi:hypothetical protein
VQIIKTKENLRTDLTEVVKHETTTTKKVKSG